jgi:hypothetical protein
MAGVDRNESPRRRIARRAGAAGMALVAALGLGACKATGGGYVGAPLDSGVIGVYSGDANFGFNFTCEVETAKKRTVIKGQITYHDDPSEVSVVGAELPIEFPEIRIHGTVKPIVFLGVTECGTAVEKLFEGGDLPVDAPPEFEGIPAAMFEGTYRSQDTTLSNVLPTEERGEFVVLVGDQGEPARPGGEFTGDLFAIDLYGGEYPAYTRGGYIEGGNIQVEE